MTDYYPANYQRTKISFSCGAASFTLKSDGTIELKGVKINVEGSETVTIKGGMIDLNP